MTTPANTQDPGKAPNLMRCYSGSSRKEITISLSPEEHERAFRRAFGRPNFDA